MNELTTERLAQFVGGQLEIQNASERYLYRGTLKSVVVEGTELHAEFLWVAKGEAFPPIPKRWVMENDQAKLRYATEFTLYEEVKVGEDRICLHSSIVGETLLFVPKGGESWLDPANIDVLPSRQFSTLRPD